MYHALRVGHYSHTDSRISNHRQLKRKDYVK